MVPNVELAPLVATQDNVSPGRRPGRRRANRSRSDGWLTPDRVIRMFSWQFYVHACACEAPAAVMECLVRAPGYLLLALWFAARAAATGGAATRMRALVCAQEAAVFAAAALSFAIPLLLACTVYRRFDAEAEEWSLAPLPTVVGQVDPRRFRVLACGNASWSRQAAATAGATTAGPFTMDDVCLPFAWCGGEGGGSTAQFHPVPRDGAFRDDAVRVVGGVAESKYDV